MSLPHITTMQFFSVLSLIIHGAAFIGFSDSAFFRKNNNKVSYNKIRLLTVTKYEPREIIKQKTIKKQTQKKIKPKIKKIKPQNKSEEKSSKKKKESSIFTQKNNLIALMQRKKNYLDKVLISIEENKSYPRFALRKNIKGRVVILMQFEQSGKITSLQCIKGHSLLCNAAMDAVRSAQPYEPLPNGMRSLSFKFEMNYNLK